MRSMSQKNALTYRFFDFKLTTTANDLHQCCNCPSGAGRIWRCASSTFNLITLHVLFRRTSLQFVLTEDTYMLLAYKY